MDMRALVRWHCSGNKKQWLIQYRNCKKVKKHLLKGRFSIGLVSFYYVCGTCEYSIWTACHMSFTEGPKAASVSAMVCNLEQNPTVRPIVGVWLPALLRSGLMWCIYSREALTGGKEERWMLDKARSHFVCLFRLCQ